MLLPLVFSLANHLQIQTVAIGCLQNSFIYEHLALVPPNIETSQLNIPNILLTLAASTASIGIPGNKSFVSTHSLKHVNPRSLVLWEDYKIKLEMQSLQLLGNPSEDFYLFHTSMRSLRTVLSKPEIRYRIKYKAAIGYDYGSFVVATLPCFFCPNSDVVINPFNLRQANKTGWELFQFPSKFNSTKFTVSVPTLSAANQVREVNGSLVVMKTGGKHLRCLLEVAKYLNFTPNLVKSSHGGATGFRQDNGTWTGAIGDVVSGRAVMATGVGIILDRLSFVDFCFPLDYVNLVFMHKSGGRFFRWESLFLAFNRYVWISLAVTTLLAVIFLKFVHELLNRRMKAKKWHAFDLLFCVVVTFVGQVFVRPRDISVQVFVSHWHFFVLTVMTMYMSKLYELFMVPSMEELPKDFNALAASAYNIGMVYHGGLIYNFFKSSSPGSSHRKLFERMHKMNLLTCHEAALNSRFACISFDGSSNIALNVYMKDVANHFVMERPGGSLVPISIVLEKHSALRETLNRAISLPLETGVAQRWVHSSRRELRDEYMKTRSKNISTTAHPSKDVSRKLSIDNLHGLVVLFMCGVFCACVAVSTEVVHFYAFTRWSGRSTSAIISVVIL